MAIRSRCPATKLPAVGARVMDLQDPSAKMSKSAAGSGHAVALPFRSARADLEDDYGVRYDGFESGGGV